PYHHHPHQTPTANPAIKTTPTTKDLPPPRPELIRSLKSFTQTSVAPFQSQVSADPGILSPLSATSLVSLRLFLSRKSLTHSKPFKTSFLRYRTSLESLSRDGGQTMLENFAA